MCLAIPGKIVSIEGEGLERIGRIQYGGAIKEASLAFISDACEGEYVLVHAGVAINKVDEEHAMSVMDYLDQIEDDEKDREKEQS